MYIYIYENKKQAIKTVTSEIETAMHTKDPTQIDHLIKPIQGEFPPRTSESTNGNFRKAHRGELQQKQTAASECDSEAT